MADELRTPVPEGFALLGLGRSFVVPQGGCRMRMTQSDGRTWLAYESSYNGQTDYEYYCARIDTEVVALNRDLVERLNPDIQFPWMASPPLAMDAPTIHRRALPDNQAILGLGGSFVHDGQNSPHLVWAITTDRLLGGDDWVDYLSLIHI